MDKNGSDLADTEGMGSTVQIGFVRKAVAQRVAQFQIDNPIGAADFVEDDA